MFIGTRKAGLLLFILAICLFASLPCATAQTTWSNGYAFRRAITIDHTKVPNANQSNFPVLVSGTFSYLATIANGGGVTSSNGYDIIFTSDAAGTTGLSFERDSYSPTTGAVILWVKVPTLSHTSDTTIYMFYGSGAVTSDTSTPSSVWDSNFAGVWHLGSGSSLSLADSTSNGYNLTNNNTVTAAVGKIGEAASFNGSNNSLSNSSLSISAGSSITISYWSYVATADVQQSAAFTIGDSDTPNRIQANAPWSDSSIYWDYGTYSSGRVNSSYYSYLNNWSHVVLEYDSSSSTHSLYLNGALVASSTNSNTPTATQTGIRIGAWPDSLYGSFYQKGQLDEFRVSTVARSADWVATEYNNQSSPSTFFSVGAADTTGSGGTPTPSISFLSPTSGPVTTPVVISGNNFGATQGTSTVSFNGVAASSILSWSGSGIYARVPSTATTGNVVVTVGSASSNTATFTITTAPGIVSIFPTSGMIGTYVTITGVNFGSTPGTVTLNGSSVTTPTWTDTSIVAIVPSGATSGPFVVTVGSQSGTSPNFTVTPIPTGWSQADVGTTGVAGSASFASNVFTVSGAGCAFNNCGYGGAIYDGFHFVYQPMSGDGTVVARITALSSYSTGGIAIRASLDATASSVALYYPQGSYAYSFVRASSGGSTGSFGSISYPSLPYWFKLVRIGATVTGFVSADGVSWSQLGSSQSVTMGSTTYVGMLVSGGDTSNLRNVSFDDVYVGTPTSPGPVISQLSATTGPIGSQVTISGSGFGAAQGQSLVLSNGTAQTINSWSDTSIGITISSGTTSGPLLVSVAPYMLDSNPIVFTVTSTPLPSGWLDRDIGSTGGSASYSSGQFTIQGVTSGSLNPGSEGYKPYDFEHLAYQTLSGDGTIIARVVSETASYQDAGLMMRASLDPTSASAILTYTNGNTSFFWYRLLPNTNSDSIGFGGSGTGYLPLPMWFKLVRTGNAISAFRSPDGVNWVQGPTMAIDMGSTIYVGLFSTIGTAVFDNVSVTSAASPSSTPVITSLSATTGSVGSQIIVSGSGFGASQGDSTVLLNDAPMTVTLWSDTAITFTIASGATSGPLVVAVAPSMNASNPVPFTVTTQPLGSGWYDYPVGGAPGDASYSSGVFTVHSNGSGVSGGWDQFHFVYQPLTTDGTIVVRVDSLSGASSGMQAGVAIRQTLDTSSAEAAAFFVNGTPTLTTRSILSGLGTTQTASGISFPYWLKLVRSQNTFAAYISSSGSPTAWTQLGTTQTIVSTRNVYVGFGVGGGGSTTQITGTFDNASVTAGGSLSNPVISGISPATGPAGTSVTISGTGFGTTTGSIFFNGQPAVISGWGDTSISAVVPEFAMTGPVSVTTGGNMSWQGPDFAVVLTAVVTDSLGNQSTYHSSGFGGQFQFTDSTGSGCSTCSTRGTVTNQFDSIGNRLWTTDELGHTTFDQYDSSSNLTAETVFPTATTPAKTTYEYNSLGQVTVSTDVLNNKVYNTYDSHGNLTAVSNWSPSGGTLSTTNFGYNSLGELTTITDPLSHVTTIAYNSVGLISSITDAQSNVTSYGYDSRGNRTSITDALSHTTTFTYDSGDRVTQITYPDSTTTSFAYDYRGRRTSVTDQNGKTTSYTYDDADRLLTVTDAASNVTTYAYDTENNLTSITDANSHETAFTYDAFGRVTQTNFPSSHIENYSYDAVGNLTSKTDRKGNTIDYVYDGLNRLTRKTYPDSTEVDYVYDLVGKIQQVNDPTGTYQFSYDGMGRLTGTTTNYSFLTGRSFTTSYTYDAASNRTGFTDPESGSTAYTYDTLNRLSTLTPPSAFTTGNFGFSYDALSRRTQMTRPNSVTTNYAYDNLSRLTSVLHQLSGSTIDGATYTVDNAGNRTAKTDKQTNVTSNYTYDSIYQLLTAAQGGSTTESYSYDPVGNRTASLGVSSYTTNSSNELTAMTGASFTYDYNGNTTSKTASGNTTNYSWDYENHLTSVTLPGTGGTVSFVYDPFGRRIKKVSSAGTSIFAYDGDNLIEETNSSGTVVARYSQGLNIDEPLAMLRSSATTYYNADGLGSITSLANTSGTLTQTYTFDSFGKQTASSGSLVNSFQYTARESDAETGLYYYRARYYDAVAGRFISADPLRLTGDVNLFAYVDQNPINAFDPLGLCKIIVKFNKVIKGLPGYHAYIVTIDPSGAMMGFRGGPGQNGNIDTLSRDYSPKSKNDPYGFPDYNPKSTPCITVLDNDKPCREYNYKLMSALADIANTNTPYPWYPFLPGSRNSNSVASDALSVSGLPVPAPPVWAPGWGNPILPFGNGGVTSGPSGPVGGGRGGPF